MFRKYSYAYDKKSCFVFKTCHLQMFLLSDFKALNDKSIYWELCMYQYLILIFMSKTTSIISMRKLKCRGNTVISDLSRIPQLLSFGASV